jgi:hypothetical protein
MEGRAGRRTDKDFRSNGMEDREMLQGNQDVSFDMHATDVERAHAAAERLGMSLSEYIRLGTHLMTTAVLSGSTTAQVPVGSASRKSWKEVGNACVKKLIERAVA